MVLNKQVLDLQLTSETVSDSLIRAGNLSMENGAALEQHTAILYVSDDWEEYDEAGLQLQIGRKLAISRHDVNKKFSHTNNIQHTNLLF